MVERVEDLVAWQKARELTRDIIRSRAEAPSRATSGCAIRFSARQSLRCQISRKDSSGASARSFISSHASPKPLAAKCAPIFMSHSTLVTLTNNAPSLSTNVTVSVAANPSTTSGPYQTGANQQLVRTVINPFTTPANHLTVALMTNLVVTADPNLVVS